MKLLNDFDKWLMDRPKWETTSHHGSSVGNCSRQLYYRWIDEPITNPDTPGGILKQRYGYLTEHLFEEFLEFYCEETGYRLQSQIKKKVSYPGLKYPISCTADYIITTPDGDVGVELKSMFGRGIVNIQKTGKPKIDYLKQIFIYSEIFQITKWLHPYIGRDSGYRTEFEVLRVPEGLQVGNDLYRFSFDDVVSKLKRIEKAVETKNIPNREKKQLIHGGGFHALRQRNKIQYKSDWECGYCSWRDTCWQEYLSKSGLWYGEEKVSDK